MEKTSARVHISLTEGILEIEGSETFVSEQLTKLEPHIVRAFETSNIKNSSSQKSVATSETDSKPPETAGLSAFEHVFAEANGRMQILKTLPGSTNSAKTISAALLLGFAYSQKGIEEISFDVIRDICKAHACLDSSNFASILKSQKNYFLISGTASSKTLKLSVPGQKKAFEVATQLNN